MRPTFLSNCEFRINAVRCFSFDLCFLYLKTRSHTQALILLERTNFMATSLWPCRHHHNHLPQPGNSSSALLDSEYVALIFSTQHKSVVNWAELSYVNAFMCVYVFVLPCSFIYVEIQCFVVVVVVLFQAMHERPQLFNNNSRRMKSFDDVGPLLRWNVQCFLSDIHMQTCTRPLLRGF